MPFTQRLKPDFYAALHADIREEMARAEVALLILDHPEDVIYATGLSHYPTERPVAFAITESDALLLVPELEREHAAHQKVAAEIVVYFEFPGVDRPFDVLARRLGRLEGRGGFGPSMAWRRVPELRSAFPGLSFEGSGIIDRLRLFKRPEEIVMHREAGRISDAMVVAGAGLVAEALDRGGELPSEVALVSHVVGHALKIMHAQHSDILVTPMLAGGLVYAGANSAFPHGMASGYRVKPGESFMLSLGCSVGGRKAESERTFIVGRPTQEQARLYDVMRDAQQRGTDAMIPGRRCSEPNAIALETIRDAGFGDHIRHRLGHGMGVAFHEPPWVEAGDETIIEPGMILSSEPAVYVPGLGGFRIADTVLITETGPDRLTNFPRRLEEVVIR